jgi:hypothetical protein
MTYAVYQELMPVPAACQDAALDSWVTDFNVLFLVRCTTLRTVGAVANGHNDKGDPKSAAPTLSSCWCRCRNHSWHVSRDLARLVG